MALLNNSNYIKITDVKFNGVITYDIYEDQAHKDNGDTNFKKHFQEQSTVDLIPFFAENPDPELSIYDNIIKQAYIALKGTEEFKDAVDLI